MKAAKITVLLMLILIKVSAQNTFVADKNKDTLWVKNLIDSLHKAHYAKTKEEYNEPEWTKGNVIYSPDKSLRIAQIFTNPNFDARSFPLQTVVQYMYQNNAIELKLPIDTINPAESSLDRPITNIYKLPNANSTYLILSSDTISVDDTDSTQNIIYLASCIRITKDSIAKLEFNDNEYMNVQDHIRPEIILGNSLYLDSYIKTDKKAPKPFVKYDEQKKELSFLTAYCDNENENTGGCNTPYLIAYSGMFNYVDTAFTMVTDTTYLYPSLDSFDKTLAVKNYKVGSYLIKAKATKTYEEVGSGILEVMNVFYEIGPDTISYINYRFDEQEKLDMKPEYRLQRDKSLIILTTDLTTPNAPGACGSGDYNESKFWSVRPKSKRLLFSYLSSSCNSRTDYIYNNGKGEVNGSFYLKNVNDDDYETVVDKEYWKDDSTYVFRVTDEKLMRNFFVHFITINNKTIAKIEVGKLEKKKEIK